MIPLPAISLANQTKFMFGRDAGHDGEADPGHAILLRVPTASGPAGSRTRIIDGKSDSSA